MTVLPQEIQVWYVIPALRRELARALIQRHRLSQKKVASILGLSEGAISQYLSSKRGINVKFSAKIAAEIEKAANKVNNDNSRVMEELMRLSELKEVKKIMCSLHLEQEPSIERNCNVCFR